MINFSGSITKKVLLFVYTVLLARLLTVDDLGEYFIMVTVVNILGLVATLGMGFGVVRYVSLFTGEGKPELARRTVRIGLTIAIPFSLVVALGLYLAAPEVSRIFFDGSGTAVTGLRIFSLALPFWVAAKIFNSTTQGMHRMQYQVYSRDFGEQISKLVLSAAVLALGAGLMGVIWANVASLVIATGLALIFALKVLPGQRQEVGRSENPTRKIVRYSSPLAVSNVIGMVLLWVDLLLLGYLGTTEDVGYYGAAIRVATATTIVLGAFCTVFSPVISDLSNREKFAELRTLFQTVTRWIFTISFLVFLLLLFFAAPVMRIFGQGFAAGSAALALLAMGKLFDAGSGPVGHMVMMSGHSKLELVNISTALGVNTLLCLLLIPRFGLIGAAIGNMSAYGVVNLMRGLEIWSLMHIQAYNRAYLKPLLAGAVGSLVIVAVRYLLPGGASDYMQLVLAALLIIFYSLVIMLFGLSDQDREVIRSFRQRLPVFAGSR